MDFIIILVLRYGLFTVAVFGVGVVMGYFLDENL